MATQRDREGLRAYMKSIIKANGVQGITGTNAQAVLDDYIDSLQFLSESTDTRYYEQYDWIGPVTIANINTLGVATLFSGTSATVSSSNYGVNSTENALGVAACETGTDTNGYSSLIKDRYIIFGTGFTFKCRWRVAHSAVSDGTDTYTSTVGFWDYGAADFSDSAYFKYTHGTNSGNWQCITSNAATATTTNTSTAGGNTTYSIFEISVNSDATSVVFKINDTTVATHTTNIPNTAVLGWLMRIEKSAGTNNRLMYQDWYDFLITRSTAR